MGQYTSLYLAEQADESPSARKLWLYESKYYVGLLWLACFRTDDIGGTESTSCLSCEVGKARRQFEEGIAILRKAFPATNFDGPTPGWDGADGESVKVNNPGRVMPEKLRDESYVDRFRRILRAEGWNRLLLDYGELGIYGDDYDSLIERALKGFDAPEQWFPYEKRMNSILKAKSPESGAMSWCYVLRTLCGRGSPFRGEQHEHLTELFRSTPGSVDEKPMLLGYYAGICLG